MIEVLCGLCLLWRIVFFISMLNYVNICSLLCVHIQVCICICAQRAQYVQSALRMQIHVHFDCILVCPIRITHVLYWCTDAKIVTENEARSLPKNRRQNSQGLLFYHVETIG
jgi:hypothetical protein